VRDGRVTRGWIGVEPGELTPELAQAFGISGEVGVLMTGILQAGPAAQAGLQPGDVVTHIDHKPVRNVAELMSTVAALRPGQDYPIDLLRAGQEQQVQITPLARPNPNRAKVQNRSWPRQ
jgi:serine protease DegQ